MNKDELEQRVLSLWMTTRMPLSRPNLQLITGVPRAKLDRWLDELVSEGVLEIDSDDAGEMLWTVPSAVRPARGLERPDEVKKLADLKLDVRGAGALVKAGASSLLAQHGRSGEKSLLAAGLLPLVVGPVGWAYAAPFKEAGVAALAYFALCSVLPHFLLVPLLGIVNPLSALVGVAYAWRHNQKGERTSLLPDDERTLPPRR